MRVIEKSSGEAHAGTVDPQGDFGPNSESQIYDSRCHRRLHDLPKSVCRLRQLRIPSVGLPQCKDDDRRSPASVSERGWVCLPTALGIQRYRIRGAQAACIPCNFCSRIRVDPRAQCPYRIHQIAALETDTRGSRARPGSFSSSGPGIGCSVGFESFRIAAVLRFGLWAKGNRHLAPDFLFISPELSC